MSHVMKHDGSGVICDQRTFKLCRGGLAFEAGEPIHVKGKNNLVPVYRPYAHSINLRSSDRLQTIGAIFSEQLERGKSFTRRRILAR